MKNKFPIKILTFIIAHLGLASISAAADVQLEMGFRQQSGDATITNYSASSQTGFQFGAVALTQFTPKIFLRSGGLYTQRPIGIDNSDSKIGLNYLDIPLTVFYKFADYGGVYGGVNFSTFFDGNCSMPNGLTCKVPSRKSPIMPLVLGGMFKIAPQFGVSLYYETMSGEVADGLGNFRAFGANFFITFD